MLIILQGTVSLSGGLNLRAESSHVYNVLQINRNFIWWIFELISI